MRPCEVCGDPLTAEYTTIETDQSSVEKVRWSCTNRECPNVGREV